LRYFARKNTIIAYLKKLRHISAFFATISRSLHQKRGNPGSFRALLESGMLMSVSNPENTSRSGIH
jgi:hypothetical protein